ncbi:MAG: efflux RND transporter periplasmic adaptor subunit, partial [Acidobacteriota bacterium]
RSWADFHRKVMARMMPPLRVGARDAEADARASESQETAAEALPIPVETHEVGTGQVSSYLTSTANLVPENEVRVLAEWEGRLARLHVEEGDSIQAGDVLAELARDDAEITLQKARVRAETARLAWTRAERLMEQELLSKDEFDKLAQAHQLAVQEQAEAEWRLEKTFIRSPFAGRVTQRAAQLGQHIRPGDELFTVADFEPLVARIYLPEQDVLDLSEGRAVNIALRADSDVRFTGTIQRISPVVDTATGTVKVTVEARRVPRAVRPGAFVRIDIVQETRQQAVLLPREAVVRELQSTYVFVDRDGVAEKRSVRLGLEENGRVEAIEGVVSGERVIVAGQGGLEDGATVERIAAAS